MGKETIGLKIGASRLAAARVVTNGVPQLLQVVEAPLPPGIVSEGEVRDVPALATALREFFAFHQLPRSGVRTGVSNNRVGVRAVEVSGVTDPRHVANAVRFRAQEVLPVPPQEAVLDFQVLRETVDADGAPTRHVLLAVAYRDLVEAYAQACAEAGLRLLGIDVEALALVRALAPWRYVEPGEEERSAWVAVNIGAERTTLAVTDGLTCEFARVISWGGRALTSALAEALGVDLETAEQIKRRVGLDETLPVDAVPDDEAERAREALQASLRTLARELVSSLQYYQNQPGSLGIRELLLAGGTAQLGGLGDALQHLTGVGVRIADPLAAVSVGRRVDAEVAGPALAVPIGLGMGL